MNLLARRYLPLALTGILAVAGSTLAQQTEYQLEDNPATTGTPAGSGWEKTAAPEPGSDAATIAQARRFLAEDQPRQAYGILDSWVEEHDRSDHELLPQALRLRGDALTASGDEYHALYDYERVIKEFPASEEYVVANERELDIATRYIAGLRRKWMGMRIVPADDIGEELLVRVQERMPGSRLAERAGVELGDFYYRTRQLEMAVTAYDVFLINFPKSSYAIKAMQRRVYATIAQYKGPNYDGSKLVDAQALITRFATLYPAQARSAGLDETLQTRLDESAAEHLLESARWYIRRDDPASARYTMQRLVRRHPQTAAAQVAMQMMEEHGWPITTPGQPAAAPEEQPIPTSTETPATPPDPVIEGDGKIPETEPPVTGGLPDVNPNQPKLDEPPLPPEGGQ